MTYANFAEFVVPKVMSLSESASSRLAVTPPNGYIFREEDIAYVCDKLRYRGITVWVLEQWRGDCIEIHVDHAADLEGLTVESVQYDATGHSADQPEAGLGSKPRSVPALVTIVAVFVLGFIMGVFLV